MNERIQELARRAQEDYVGYQDKGLYYEIFAKLIVQECCDKFVDMQHKFHPSICAYEIKKHFGVEE